MKLVINRCYGGFNLSKKACDILKCDKWHYSSPIIQIRSNEKLVEAIEQLGSDAASGSGSKLKVIEVPDDIYVYISYNDGLEAVEEVHRVWA